MEYPWYDLLEMTDEITQGDLLFNCPVPILSVLDSYESDQTVNADIEYIDGIILTQACDIANGKIDNIILCSITSKTDFEKQLSLEGKSEKEIRKIIEGIIKGQQNAYHIIKQQIFYACGLTSQYSPLSTKNGAIKSFPFPQNRLSFAKYPLILFPSEYETLENCVTVFCKSIAGSLRMRLPCTCQTST